MVDDAEPSAPIVLSAAEYRIAVELDRLSGLPRALTLEDGRRWDLATGLTLELGGQEERHPTGGIRYLHTEAFGGPQLVSPHPTMLHRGTHLEFELGATLGGLRLGLLYRLYPTHPFVEFAIRVSTDDEATIRSLRVDIEATDERAPEWLVNAPGNGLRRNVPLADLGDDAVGVSPIGGLRGSSGLVAVTEQGGTTLSVWANSPADIGAVSVIRPRADALRITMDTGLSARIGQGASVEVLVASLDLQAAGIGEIARQWPDWTSRSGLTTPPEKPSWIRRASIYEVQIGTSYFWGQHEYCRYASIAEFTNDLDRVQSLGFDVIQLMPLQPFPSYNVHDYFDIGASYGDADELTALIAECHRRGMRIILDVLLHGVIDQESIDRAEAGVRDGPLYSRLTRELGDSFSEDVGDQQSYLIAWSRHILDFAPHWRAGSPPRSPLQDEHPDWFFRATDGEVTGVYTKAFDARSPGWQDYFRGAVRMLLELGVDGFRFDAPTYNDFANWSPEMSLRASASPLGSVPLFVDLRQDIKTINPDALMYTEPSGHLLRRSMDVNYNYDEQWLVTALGALDAVSGPSKSVRSAREFGEWMEDRDAFLPPGALTAHHIDSHDTFWWPEWGRKWRREQFPLPVVRALAVAFMALEGPYMMFAGGEEGLEDVIRAMNGLRADPALPWHVTPEFVRAPGQDDQLLHVVRRDRSLLGILVNLSHSRTVSFGLEDAVARVRFSDRSMLIPESGRGSIDPLGVMVVETVLS